MNTHHCDNIDCKYIIFFINCVLLITKSIASVTFYFIFFLNFVVRIIQRIRVNSESTKFQRNILFTQNSHTNGKFSPKRQHCNWLHSKLKHKTQNVTMAQLIRQWQVTNDLTLVTQNITCAWITGCIIAINSCFTFFVLK